MGGVAAFIDAEHALDTAYAKALGVKIPQILQSQYEERLKLIDDRKMTKELVYSIIGILMGTLALITFLVLLLRK